MTFEECVKRIEFVQALVNVEFKEDCRKHKLNLKCERCVARKTVKLLEIYKQKYIK